MTVRLAHVVLSTRSGRSVLGRCVVPPTGPPPFVYSFPIKWRLFQHSRTFTESGGADSLCAVSWLCVLRAHLSFRCGKEYGT